MSRSTYLLIVATGLTAVALSWPAQASSSRDWDRCKDVNNKANAEQNIAACTRILSQKNSRTNRAIAYANRCGIYNTLKRYDRALADCDQAISLDRKLGFAYNNRANAYSAKNDNVSALADYTEAIKLKPRYSLAYNNRGLVYYDMGQYDRAITDFDAAIRLDHRYAKAYNSRGNAYY